MTTERDLKYELCYSNYIDMENGDDTESIDYRSLIHILTELMSRIEKLEAKNETHRND
jgi:hypothetical protein